MRLRALSLVGLVAASGGAACSLVTSLDGYAGSASSAADAADDAPVDRRSDAAPPDAAAPDAEPSEGGPRADAGPWCKTNAPDARFCADFDTSGATPYIQNVANGTLTVVDAGALSPPNALVASVYAGAPDAGAAMAYAGYATAAPFSDITVRVDVRPEVVGTDAALAAPQILKLIVPAGTPDPWELGVLLGATNQSLILYEYNNPTLAYAEPVSTAPLPVGAWSTLEVHLWTQGTATMAELRVDGVLRGQPSAVHPPKPLPQPFMAVAGIPYVSAPRAAWTVRIDDFVVNAR